MFKKFIYRGFYYPVFGSSVGWVNKNTKCLVEKRLGGWKNADKWWSFSYGIHCKIFNPEKPYRQFVIDTIKTHPEMKILKEYFSIKDASPVDKNDNCAKFCMYSVYTIDNKYIGNIHNAYMLKNLRNFESSKKNGKTINIGYDIDKKTWYGWSHRGICGFTYGDKIFEEDCGDDKTIYTQHGIIEIRNLDQAKHSAKNFANYIS